MTGWIIWGWIVGTVVGVSLLCWVMNRARFWETHSLMFLAMAGAAVAVGMVAALWFDYWLRQHPFPDAMLREVSSLEERVRMLEDRQRLPKQ